jgi:hypothetical protein
MLRREPKVGILSCYYWHSFGSENTPKIAFFIIADLLRGRGGRGRGRGRDVSDAD